MADNRASDLRALLEFDLSWRVDEIRFVRNQIGAVTKESEKAHLRRAGVVLIYAHFEGFSKTVFREYIRVVTNAKVSCQDAAPQLAAATLSKEFEALIGGEKAPDFREDDDSKIHVHWRRTRFLQESSGFLSRYVALDDDIVDTESNLTPRVFKKLLFITGLDPNLVRDHHGILSELVSRRHAIAHGEQRDGPSEIEYTRVERTSIAAMEKLMLRVEAAVRAEEYILTKR